MHSQFFQVFLEIDLTGLGVFGHLNRTHFLPLIPVLVLYCLVLISRDYNKDVFPRLSYLTLPPFFSHIFFFLMVC